MQEQETIRIGLEKDLEERVSDKLDRLGLKTASKKFTSAQKQMFAYGKYQFVTQEKIDAFNEKLRKDTLVEDKNAYQYKRLMFVPLDKYGTIPPTEVLDKLEAAIEDKCFDHFEVTKIDWIREVKDPILFGRIEGCPDYFFIAQWDDDIKIEDLI